MTNAKKIPVREQKAIIRALKSGVVPSIGLQHIQVGRKLEIESIVGDIDQIVENGSTIRFISGDYGAGKTFFLHLTRMIALQKGLLVMHADLSPDRRLHATKGQARGLFTELTKNCSTQTRKNGGALEGVVERFIDKTRKEALQNGQPVSVAIREKLGQLEGLVSGYDFADVITIYYKAFEDGDKVRQNDALRWLRGEYASKIVSRQAIGVRSIIDDANVYDYLKLYAGFAQLAGYKGLLVSLDEMVNLFKLQSAQARKNNYEQILRIFNDVLQGKVQGLGIMFGATPEFITDQRRGLYSYEALQTRLAANSFAVDGFVDLSGPVMSLEKLSEENLFVLLEKISLVFAKGDQDKNMIDDAMLKAFMAHSRSGLGNTYFQTPRTVIKQFVSLLSVLEQNPTAQWEALLGKVQVEKERPKTKIAVSVNPLEENTELDQFSL